jgi:hypothetical protein
LRNAKENVICKEKRMCAQGFELYGRHRGSHRAEIAGKPRPLASAPYRQLSGITLFSPDRAATLNAQVWPTAEWRVPD